ncbi:GNAT family N-acetyltransferase [Thiomicrorhabdus sediminis]|uniref:GNAT family N-acetyltransferase n=1 Tax=Thiomicrorhabdus sediminis TaxID=2580412 RepID=A0A4P9K4V3_9GAMM|nr:GNAT family N-acetyltransferase [Thiomicrorhabdus sediminis]QCU89989.1 GNAT family N-acetyltransferase [Thiomicrorhabdus sediminis]
MLQIVLTDYQEPNRSLMNQIRFTVFCDEQGVDPALELDEFDEVSIHALAFVDGKPVATGRMQDDGHIGRIAVLKAYRGQNIGSAVMNALIDQAKKKGLDRVYLGSQLTAIPFYQKLGFAEYGDIFLDADIEHKHMELVF